MIRYLCFIVFLVFSLSFFAGCAKKELTAEEALLHVTAKSSGILSRTVAKNPEIKNADPTLIPTLEKMKAAGYISMTEMSGRYQVTPTEKLAPFIISEDADALTVKIGVISVANITGVTRKGDDADVAYMTKLVTNQLAEEVFAPVSNPSPGPNHVTLRWADGRWN